jgi:type VI secretion system protein ImpK
MVHPAPQESGALVGRPRSEAVDDLPTRFEAKPGNPNPIIRAAMPLLIVASRVSATEGDPDALGARAVEGIRRFEEDALGADVAEEDVLAARYVLCAFLDEVVLTTPWGGESGWSNQSLLLTFHKETWGGEKVFEILKRAKDNPQQYLDLVEYIDTILALGFEGRYRIIQNGRASLAELRDDNYDILQRYGPEPPMALSVDWEGRTTMRRRRIALPLWITGLATIIVLSSVYAFFETRLNQRVAPVAAELESLTEEPVPPPPVRMLRQRTVN